jgi:hypothetical protein
LHPKVTPRVNPDSIYVACSVADSGGELKSDDVPCPLEEQPSRVLGIMAAILASLHMQNADDLFGDADLPYSSSWSLRAGVIRLGHLPDD